MHKFFELAALIVGDGRLQVLDLRQMLPDEHD
jgi:hypothetical protein